jgi:hypothetical protein
MCSLFRIIDVISVAIGFLIRKVVGLLTIYVFGFVILVILKLSVLLVTGTLDNRNKFFIIINSSFDCRKSDINQKEIEAKGITL